MSLLKVSKSFTLPYRANFLRYVKTTSAYSNNFLNTNLKASLHTVSEDKEMNTNKKYSFDPQSLPEETLYIFDGTAMLFHSYFANGAANNGVNKTTTNNGNIPYDTTTNSSLTGAVLNKELNKKIISSMSDDEIRSMLDCFNGIQGIQQKDNATNITTIDRESLQLRCEPLVSVLTNFARFIRDIKPKYVAVAFDAGRNTFRRDLYPSYKLHRTEVRKKTKRERELHVVVLCSSSNCYCVYIYSYYYTLCTFMCNVH